MCYLGRQRQSETDDNQPGPSHLLPAEPTEIVVVSSPGLGPATRTRGKIEIDREEREILNLLWRERDMLW